MDFTEARRIVTARLAELYANEPESPTVLPYGWQSRTWWAPMIRWHGILGVYIFTVDKTSGELVALSLPDFQAMPQPKRVGLWPRRT